MNSQEKKSLKRASMMNLLWLLIALVALGGVTYAWFNFNNETNIEPNQGSTVSYGEESLLISTTEGGSFNTQCTLMPQSNGGDLRPMSTDSLKKFYSAVGQDSNGISVLFQETTNKVNSWTIHGSLYLNVKGGTRDMDVYLFKEKLNFGNNLQALSAMRLGIKPQGGNHIIFKLDDMADTSGAAQRRTTPKTDVVVSSITNGGANYVADKSSNISDYSAKATGAEDKFPKAGPRKLCTVGNGQVVKVEYWLYLEGCDINTINDVQNKDVKLQLSFAGVPSGN